MDKEFLTFTYKIPKEPSKNRVAVWRLIKELGAVYLQQGVVLLPYNEDLYSVLRNLREQVNAFGGRATLGIIRFLNEEDEKDIVAEFIKQIDEEYEEFIRNCQHFVDEIDTERTQGDFSFSEIIEHEEEYKKFQRWYETITKKSYFKSEQQVHAIEILKKAKLRLQDFSNEVYQRDENNR